MPRVEASALVTFNPPSVFADATLREALETCGQWELREIFVVDRTQQLQGMLELPTIVEAAEASAEALDQPASCCMSPCQATFSLQQSPRAALLRMLDQNLRSLAVVEQERLVGIVTRNDFLREFAFGGGRLAQSPVTSHAHIATEGLEAAASVTEAREAMQSDRTDFIAIVQSGCPLGAFTSDSLQLAEYFLRADWLLQNKPLSHNFSLMSLLKPNSGHVRPGQTLGEAASAMIDAQATALLVINKANRILGVLTEATLLDCLLSEGL
jgi:CBS domain-containing protein